MLLALDSGMKQRRPCYGRCLSWGTFEQYAKLCADGSRTWQFQARDQDKLNRNNPTTRLR